MSLEESQAGCSWYWKNGRRAREEMKRLFAARRRRPDGKSQTGYAWHGNWLFWESGYCGPPLCRFGISKSIKDRSRVPVSAEGVAAERRSNMSLFASGVSQR